MVAAKEILAEKDVRARLELIKASDFRDLKEVLESVSMIEIEDGTFIFIETLGFNQVPLKEVQKASEDDVTSTMHVKSSRYWKTFAAWKKRFKKLNNIKLIGFSPESRFGIYIKYFHEYYYT